MAIIIAAAAGPWGPFSAPFGQLEEAVCDAGADLIDEVFTGEEDVHIVRRLRCLVVRLRSSDAKEIPDAEQLPKLLCELPSFTKNEEALKMAEALLEKNRQLTANSQSLSLPRKGRAFYVFNRGTVNG
ncbi:MAG: hypothetical protein IJL52_00790 [Clostridia bacterium]|nr:hypothetical protein [Clostridia bacterium]